MNADDAGAIRRSSRGARSIALPPSLPDDSIPSPSPSSFFSPVRRRQRRDDAHERVPREQSPPPSGSRPVLAFVARLRRRSRRRVHRIRSIGFDPSFVRSRAPTSAECRERMHRSSRVTVRLPFVIGDSRHSICGGTSVRITGRITYYVVSYSVLVLFIHTTRVFHRTRPRRLVSETSEND